MKAHPEQAVEALIIHNNLITKAKWDCFGSTVEQEGGECACSWTSLKIHPRTPSPAVHADSFAIIFSEAADAAKFCLQVWSAAS